MTPEEHKARHQTLHTCLDELATDYVLHHHGAILRRTSVMELMAWSHEQKQHPSEEHAHQAHPGAAICAHCGKQILEPDLHICALLAELRAKLEAYVKDATEPDAKV